MRQKGRRHREREFCRIPRVVLKFPRNRIPKSSSFAALKRTNYWPGAACFLALPREWWMILREHKTDSEKNKLKPPRKGETNWSGAKRHRKKSSWPAKGWLSSVFFFWKPCPRRPPQTGR